MSSEHAGIHTGLLKVGDSGGGNQAPSSDVGLKNFSEGIKPQGWESLCSPPSKLISGMICEHFTQPKP